MQTAEKTVAFYTLGCKLNFSETSTIARQFKEEGFSRVEFDERAADVYVINTCSVTDQADKKCRSIVNRALRFNPKAFVAVIGCYAQLKPTEIAAIPGVDIVLGASEKFNLVNYLESFEKREAADVHACEIKDVKNYNSAYSAADRTRTFLKVQDGCDYFCSFCTIPLARGRSRSDSTANVVKMANEIAAKGVKEVVLTGVNIGDFGKGTAETFYQLVQELDKVEGIERFRISSIEPNLLTDEIVRFVAQSTKFVPHFHIPLQSGSNTILKAMRRRYERELYASRIALIKELMPECCIGVDVIVGFPCETEEEFLQTYNFLNELNISYLHVFTYSERDNTTAVRVTEGVVPMAIRQQRNKMLTILSEKKRRKFYEENIGAIATVLWEAERDGEFMHGFTQNYVKVKTPFAESLVNQTAQVNLVNIDTDGVVSVELVEVVSA
jgi:threonylcarbamoyladenosine tRNA methylthiotransferase MtaB